MDFIEITVPCMCAEDAEILMAELSDFPFEGFEAGDTSLKAYISAGEMETHMASITDILRSTGTRCTSRTIPQRNWNAEWEASFEPVEAGNVVVRAPFHQPPAEGKTDIVIMPKMSFGTGHHATTRLMIRLMESASFDGKRVLDMGSGTGILSILAARMGAVSVDAVDIDQWAWENCTENVGVNGAEAVVKPVLGDVATVAGNSYDIILANINRNILTRDMEAYGALLSEGGSLFISGILDRDLEHIDRAALGQGLARTGELYEDGWCGAIYSREN